MALANFFTRAFQAINQVAYVTNLKSLSNTLNEYVISVVFSDDSLKLPNTEVMLKTAVNLLSRLYTRINIKYTGTKEKGREKKEKLIELCKSINPDIDINTANASSAKTIALCIGTTVIKNDTRIYISADSWNIEVSLNNFCSEIDGKIYNPLSAVAVACFGVSEIFKIVFLNGLDVEPHYVFSLLEMKKELTPKVDFPDINLEKIHIVGLGAVGNALVWSLSFIKRLSGSISIIDPEKVDSSNLQRYMLTDQTSIGTYKTDLIEKFLERDGLHIKKFPVSLGEYVHQNNPECNFDIIAISVDNPGDRVAAQALLPRIITNAWTGESGQFGVSHHWFSSPKACLACIYLAKGKVKSYTDKIAEFIGFELNRTIDLVVNQKILTHELLQEISAIKKYEMSYLTKWEGHTLTDFYHDAVCGGMALHINPNDDNEIDLVPLSHQSALAGAFLAVDLVKISLGLVNERDPVEIRLNTLTTISEYTLQQRGKTNNPKCICLDDDYLAVYKEKHKF